MNSKDYINDLLKWAKDHRNIIADFDISDEEINDFIIEINKIYSVYKKCNNGTNNDSCAANGYHFILTKINQQIYLKSYLCPKVLNSNSYLINNNYWYSNIDLNKNHQLLKKEDILVDQNDINKIKLIKLLLKIKKHQVNNVRGIFLSGDFNVGKSYLITAFCNEMALQNKSIVYIVLSDLVIEIKKAINNNSNFSDEIREKMIACDILVIDEFDQEQYSNFIHNQILYNALNLRNDENKLTIFIAKHDLNYITKKVFKPNTKNGSEHLINRLERIVQKNIYNLDIKKH